jgi:TMEM175 potassium channel family protein
MRKGRLEAFSDGVIAILITIMVLELKIPEGSGLEALRAAVPAFLAYVLSFFVLGIYWNNHHHMLHATDAVNGAILWANLHLLFWLSLIPAVTAWLGETRSAPVPTAVYGVVLVLSAIAYTMLQTMIVRHQGRHARLAMAIGSDIKGKASIVLYVTGIAFAFVNVWIADALYVGVTLMWLVPDRRIESTLAREVT